ncbi:hypothetical protein [Paenibacillus dendrobii]|uniref:hypothetical protein n=1 Tax=Paenibacillus dendrobii TaxID=2691084 RepID=UPI001F45A3C0|nr:hypothetical protein [Paenibacillus dendrobii]
MIPLVFLAVALAIVLMCGFYFAIAYFGLKFLFKKVFHRSVDPVILLAVITICAFFIQIGQRLWYHQSLEATLLLPPIAVLFVLLRRIRMRNRQR